MVSLQSVRHGLLKKGLAVNYPTRFYTGPDDCTWIRETALKGIVLPDFQSFELRGNEDCPTVVSLHLQSMPTYTDRPIAVYVLQDDGSYLRKGQDK